MNNTTRFTQQPRSMAHYYAFIIASKLDSLLIKTYNKTARYNTRNFISRFTKNLSPLFSTATSYSRNSGYIFDAVTRTNFIAWLLLVNTCWCCNTKFKPVTTSFFLICINESFTFTFPAEFNLNYVTESARQYCLLFQPSRSASPQEVGTISSCCVWILLSGDIPP